MLKNFPKYVGCIYWDHVHAINVFCKFDAQDWGYKLNKMEGLMCWIIDFNFFWPFPYNLKMYEFPQAWISLPLMVLIHKTYRAGKKRIYISVIFSTEQLI